MTEEKSFIINEKVFVPYIGRVRIQAALESLSHKIRLDYADKNPLFLIVLKGSIFFAADILRLLNIDCEIETIRAKSYGGTMQSSGDVQLAYHGKSFENRHIVIIEDIVDTGHTLSRLMQKLMESNPASVECVSLLSKPAMRKVEVRVKYIGIEIEPVFVIGYGMDFDEKGRHLPEIYSLKS